MQYLCQQIDRIGGTSLVVQLEAHGADFRAFAGRLELQMKIAER